MVIFEAQSHAEYLSNKKETQSGVLKSDVCFLPGISEIVTEIYN